MPTLIIVLGRESSSGSEVGNVGPGGQMWAGNKWIAGCSVQGMA